MTTRTTTRTTTRRATTTDAERAALRAFTTARNASVKAARARNEALLAIAKEHLFLETLDTQRGGVDFREQAVWCIKSALEAAFKAGQEAKA